QHLVTPKLIKLLYDFKVSSVNLQGCYIPYHESQDFKDISKIDSGGYAAVYRNLPHSNNILIHKGVINIACLQGSDTKAPCGVIPYMEPKTFKLSKKSDIYSLGVLF
ncbi:3753_t:CDS:2, partial [Funneliformis geosporum]